MRFDPGENAAGRRRIVAFALGTGQRSTELGHAVQELVHATPQGPHCGRQTTAEQQEDSHAEEEQKHRAHDTSDASAYTERESGIRLCSVYHETRNRRFPARCTPLLRTSGGDAMACIDHLVRKSFVLGPFPGPPRTFRVYLSVLPAIRHGLEPPAVKPGIQSFYFAIERMGVRSKFHRVPARADVIPNRINCRRVRCRLSHRTLVDLQEQIAARTVMIPGFVPCDRQASILRRVLETSQCRPTKAMCKRPERCNRLGLCWFWSHRS